MNKYVATTLAFLIAPLVVALVFPAMSIIGGDLELFDTTTFVWIFIFYCYALAVMIIIGLPTYLLLNRFRMITWWTALLAGLFCGAMMVIIFDSLALFVAMPLGGLSALVFWLIWRLGNGQQNAEATEKLTT